jgi:RimJ/RimL family protein N-acetyltransferase
MRKYKCLTKQVFELDNFELKPLRIEDKYHIMKWRNEQMYHLRQSEALTKQKQDYYFDVIVSKLFELDQPPQVLFSYLLNDVCIGYGGLVHINWLDKNAEISFIINTELEKEYFSFHWTIFLKLINEVAFSQLCLQKIFTFAFDLRPHLYEVIESNGFLLEATLKEHCFYDGKFIDVLIHSKWK